MHQSVFEVIARMRIVFLRSNDYDITPAIPRALEASEGLFDEVHVLCWNRHNRSLPREVYENGIRIRRFMTRTPRPRSIRILFATLLYQGWVFFNLLRIRADVVHACGVTSGFSAGLACCLLRKTFVYDIRDPFALCYKCSPLIRRLAYGVDWCVMGLASAFVVPTRRYVAYMGRWGRSDRGIHVIPNTCHDLRASLPSVSAMCGPAKTGVVRLAYLGYLTANRGSQWLLDLCQRDGKSIELLVAGGCRSAELQAQFESMHNIRFLGWVPYNSSLALMREADAVTILYDPSLPVNRVLDPTKFYEAMMVGTPVLVSAGVSVADEVERNGLGFVVEHGDIESLHEVVDSLKDHMKMSNLRARCRKYYVENMQLSKDLAEYRDFYLRLVANKSHGSEAPGKKPAHLGG